MFYGHVCIHLRFYTYVYVYANVHVCGFVHISVYVYVYVQDLWFMSMCKYMCIL